jgi:hypothetical protein
VLVWVAVVLDAVCVLVFALVGRRSHAEAGDVVGVLRTAWPFLAGAAAGWLVGRGWRRPGQIGTGVLVWMSTVLVGLTLRVLSGSTAQWPFVIVATLTLGLLLVGWRIGWRLALGIARYLSERRSE